METKARYILVGAFTGRPQSGSSAALGRVGSGWPGLEDLLDGESEDARESEGERQARIVAAGLDRIDGLTRDPEPLRELRLRPAPLRAQNDALAAKDADVSALNSKLAEVVSELPKGWWQTPYEGPLAGTRVEVVGSDKLLICDYQAYTTQAPVMMKVPASTDCVAVDGGFNCR